jgi:hypothetical protein
LFKKKWHFKQAQARSQGFSEGRTASFGLMAIAGFDDDIYKAAYNDLAGTR